MKTALILVLATIVALSAPSRSSIKLVITKPNISSRSSALRWLSWKEIRSMMAEGSWDFKKQGHFVRPGRYPGNIYGGRFICKAAVGDQSLGKGCEYPGEAGFNPINDWEGGEKWCVVTTKTESKRLENESDFTVLWNHRNAARLGWVQWASTGHTWGTGDTAFPPGVVMSDTNCDHMVGRHMGDNFWHLRGSTAMIDRDGYAYYAERQYCCPKNRDKLMWFWDDNQYDLLVELTTERIEILELRYGDASYNETRNLEGQDSVFQNLHNETSEVKADLEMSPVNVTQTWSHSLHLAVEDGATLKVTHPTSIEGAVRIEGFYEESYSSEDGWSGSVLTEITMRFSVTQEVPPLSNLTVREVRVESTVKWPYAATYRLTYEDGSKNIVEDEGDMTMVRYSWKSFSF